MLRVTMGHLRVGGIEDAAGIGEECRARLGAIEEIEPLAGHRPEQGCPGTDTPRAIATGS